MSTPPILPDQLFQAYPYKKELIEGIEKKWFPVFIKYPVYPKPRYGYDGKAPHRYLYDVMDRRRTEYHQNLKTILGYRDFLFLIGAHQPDDSKQPFWDNLWFSGLDAMALYSFIAAHKPPTYLEIGSGNSTKFVRRAISDHHLTTRIVSVDPNPREEIDSLSDEVIRKPLEECRLELFDNLTDSDILFFDGSHRCFMNSDVTVFFLEVLPKLPSGILIHIHDIHLPYDYPPERALHYESEQYLLASMLLGGCSQYEIVLPNKFVLNDGALSGVLDEFWKRKESGIAKRGASFWIRKR